jgi:hypothetical protein
MANGDVSQLGRERVERCWRAALHYHQLIDRAERASYGYAPEARAYLLKIAKGFEHEAREAELALGVVAS